MNHDEALAEDPGGSGADVGIRVTLLVVGAQKVAVVTCVNNGVADVKIGAVPDAEIDRTIDVGARGTADVGGVTMFGTVGVA